MEVEVEFGVPDVFPLPMGIGTQLSDFVEIAVIPADVTVINTAISTK